MRSIVLAASCLLVLEAGAALAQPAPISTYWPHEDGRTWFYDQHSELFVSPFDVRDNLARLSFEGTTVAAGGVPAQVLVGTVASLPAGPRLDREAPAEVTGPLLRRVWLARPDLRAAILQAATQAPCPNGENPEWDALLLAGGFAYAQTESEVAAWRCDAPNTRSWLWFTSDLDPGSTATLQLVPDLASDIVLHLEVVGLVDATVPGGTFEDCLQVDYVIDYGWSMCTDKAGNHLGDARHETTGFVRYAPGVGPVESIEEFAIAEGTGFCPGASGPIVRTTLKLNTPSVSATASSWGRVKSVYRR